LQGQELLQGQGRLRHRRLQEKLVFWDITGVRRRFLAPVFLYACESI
jgi:hypothetical protein